MEKVIRSLEVRIQELIQQYENLRQSKLELMREKDLLLAKHNIAVAQIETMVLKLKSIEKA